MSLIGLLASTEKIIPEGHLHMRPFQFHFKEHWRCPLWLDSLLPFCTPRVVVKSHKRDERCRPSSERPQHPTLYRRLKRRLGRSLRTNLYKRSVVRQGKKASHIWNRWTGSFYRKICFNQPVTEPNDQVLAYATFIDSCFTPNREIQVK